MKHRSLAVSMTVAIALVTAFASCGKVEDGYDGLKDLITGGEDEFVVSGKVTNGTAPLKGVAVTSPEGVAVSDDQGVYKLSLPEGSHAVTFKTAGHIDAVRNVSGKAGQKVALDVTLSPVGTANPVGDTSGEAGGEFVFARGKYVERTVNPNGGWIEFEVWLPESGRRNDWGFAAVLEMYQGVPNRYSSFLPYKIKTCAYRDCREPRYGLRWDQWRKVRFEWDQKGVMATIDGVRVAAPFSGAWAAGPVMLCYGHRPNRYGPISGAKMRNIVWSN